MYLEEEENEVQRDFSYMKSHNEDGSSKPIGLVCFHYPEEDLYDTVKVAFFNSVAELKVFMSNKEEMDELKDVYGEDLKLEVYRVNTPYSDENIAKLKEKYKDDYEPGMLFCPYCGKYRYFYENEYDSNCDACGVSQKNYDVQKHN